VVADYVKIVEVMEPLEVPRVVPTDADDDHVVAAAVAAKAAFIVSGDSDLLRLGSHQGINIVSAATLVEQISDGAAGFEPRTSATPPSA
jgi:uncharacterized protein